MSDKESVKNPKKKLDRCTQMWYYSLDAIVLLPNCNLCKLL
jgi:hypothetical protein